MAICISLPDIDWDGLLHIMLFLSGMLASYLIKVIFEIVFYGVRSRRR